MFTGFTLQLDQWPSEVGIRRNMASSPWTDAEMMIRSNALAVFTAEGQPDEEDTIIAIFEGGNKKAPLGASLRWAVIVADDNMPAIMLQSLPLPEPSIVAKPPLRGDAAAVISVAVIPLWCNLFDGNNTAGPVPIIACHEDDRPAVTDDLVNTHRELQRLAGVFGQPEFLNYKEAAIYVKKPKPGQRDFPFKRRALSPSPPAAKRSRTDAPSTTAAGKIAIILS